MYTVNNYTPEDEKRLQALECSYHVYGREIGDEGTPHLQGCITFQTAYRFRAAVRVLGGHLTVPKVLDQARNYCLKGNDFVVVDHRKKTQRSDLLVVAEAVAAGGKLHMIGREFPSTFIRYHRGIGALMDCYQDCEPRTAKPFVTWIYGDTGSGKTRGVHEAEPSLWTSSADLSTFFNGYRNQVSVLLDDFRGGQCKFSFLLRLLDRYQLTVNVKNGYKEWNPKRIWITCNRDPQGCYPNIDERNMGQLLRRVDEIFEFRFPTESFGELDTVVKTTIKGDSTTEPIPAEAVSSGFILPPQ